MAADSAEIRADVTSVVTPRGDRFSTLTGLEWRTIDLDVEIFMWFDWLLSDMHSWYVYFI